MLKLYYAPGSIALASHIMLEETGAPYEAIKVDFAANEQRGEEYLRLNPKGRVPCLVTDQGILTETPAILTFLAQSFPAKALAPTDTFAFARAQSFAAYLCATVHVAHAHKMRGYRWANDPAAIAEMRRKVPETMTAAVGLIEGELFEGPWVMGDAYSFCDPYLFTMTGWAVGDGVDMSRLPKLAGHMARMQERPAVRAVVPLHQV